MINAHEDKFMREYYKTLGFAGTYLTAKDHNYTDQNKKPYWHSFYLKKTI